MFKKVKVIMISCFDNSEELGIKWRSDGKLHYLPGGDTIKHLYFLSDDEIKEDDWYLFNDSIHQLRRGDIASTNCKKIIATTDTSLSSITHSTYPSGNTTGVRTLVELPQPSISFIEKYIKEYNNNIPITDVLVEYWAHTEEYPQLKVNSKDNTITIKKVKDSWSREEVELHCRIAFYAGMANTPMTGEKILNEWIESNL